jgi:formate dehydrogenase alpha subunit
VAGLVTTFGSGSMTNSLAEIKDCDCMLAIGTNTTETHPVIWLEMKKARDKGAKLIVANPRRIPLVEHADIWLNHRPGSDVALLMGMMKIIVDEGLADDEFVSERCENFDAFRESLKQYNLDFVSDTTGVAVIKIIAAARMYATADPAAIFYTMGITQHTHGTDNVMAVANLAMLTGNVGKPSSGVNPLRGQNNVQGACDMGALPNVYPGYQPVADDEKRARFEQVWGTELPSKPGMVVTEMMPAALEGRIKAMYIIGENPLLSDPDISHIEAAVKKLEFLVVQDIFLTETAKYADVVLPAVSFMEKDGTFTNTERRVQKVRKVMEPVGQSRADWEITSDLARRMGGGGFDHKNPAQIMDEIALLTPSYGGISHARLERETLQWPCPLPDYPGMPYLHKGIFSRGMGRFMPLEYRASAEMPDTEYPLMMTSERSRYHYHTATMTGKSDGLNRLQGQEWLEICADDAATLDINDGETVRVVSRRGEIEVKIKVSPAAAAGLVSMGFHFADSPTNRLTNPAIDPVSKIPEYKVTAVRVEKLNP